MKDDGIIFLFEHGEYKVIKDGVTASFPNCERAVKYAEDLRALVREKKDEELKQM